MNEAKIRLSTAEMDLVNNAEVILTKNAILRKALYLLGSLQEKQQVWLDSTLPHFSKGSSPKISKGENYRGLPYLVLDYPRRFEPGALFMIRSMFWWGHYFSITLHASGHFAATIAVRLVKGFAQLKERDFYNCINEDPWQHHFEEDNYRPLSAISPGEFDMALRSKPFIKLGKKIPLAAWDDAVSLLAEDFRLLAALCEESRI